MNWIKRKWQQFDVKPKTIRDFGVILAGLLIVFGGVALWRGKLHYQWEWPLAGGVLLLTFFAPKYLSYVYRVWMIVAERISWVLLRLMLGVLFYLVISPISFFARLFGKDLLDQKIDREASSYWKKRKRLTGRETYEKLF